MNRRGFLATLFAVPFAPLAWKLAPTAVVYEPLAYTSAATAEQLEALRRYNYAVSQWADTLMLAPKAPRMTMRDEYAKDCEFLAGETW